MLRALIYFNMATIIVYLVLLVATGWHIGDALFSGNVIGNVLYQLDTIASITIGSAWIADPQWLLHRQVFI